MISYPYSQAFGPQLFSDGSEKRLLFGCNLHLINFINIKVLLSI